VTVPLSLEDYADKAEDLDEADIVLHVKGLVPPKTVENLRRLRRLGLLRDEVLLSLVGQAPIDPYGIFGALQRIGVWAFQPLDCTAVQVLAKKGSKPVAIMSIDLLSDNITFVALKAGQLVMDLVLEADVVLAKLREHGATEERVLVWLQGYIDATIKKGMAAI
jgi:hypothetical protein